MAIVLLIAQVMSSVSGISWLEKQSGTISVALIAAVLLYLVSERSDLVDRIQASGSSRSFALRSQEEAYGAACRAMESVWHNAGDEKVIRMATLYGARGDRVAETHDVVENFKRFEYLLGQCVLAKGTDAWSVKVLYNVTTRPRLDMILASMDRWRNAERYEVRVFFRPDAISLLGPLIVGGRNLLLGLEDERYYRTSRAIHIEGEDVTALGVQYFESLWSDRETIVLRSSSGIDSEGVTKISGLVAP
jgi:hypothetical protein